MRSTIHAPHHLRHRRHLPHTRSHHPIPRTPTHTSITTQLTAHYPTHHTNRFLRHARATPTPPLTRTHIITPSTARRRRVWGGRLPTRNLYTRTPRTPRHRRPPPLVIESDQRSEQQHAPCGQHIDILTLINGCIVTIIITCCCCTLPCCCCCCCVIITPTITIPTHPVLLVLLIFLLV
jgi:hypothetical protein